MARSFFLPSARSAPRFGPWTSPASRPIARWRAPGGVRLRPRWRRRGGGAHGRAWLAWQRHRLRPRVLVDVSSIDLSTATLLGAPLSMPVAIAPMAIHGLADPAPRRPWRARRPPRASRSRSRRCRTVPNRRSRPAHPTATCWFQLYVHHNCVFTPARGPRPQATPAIVLTVDLPPRHPREGPAATGSPSTRAPSATSAAAAIRTHPPRPTTTASTSTTRGSANPGRGRDDQGVER